MTDDDPAAGSSLPCGDALSRRLQLIERCEDYGRQMLRAARCDDWREVQRLEQHRRQLAGQLRFEDLPAELAPALLEAMRRLVEQAGSLDKLAKAERDQRSRALYRSRQSAGAIHAYVDEQYGLRADRGPIR